MKKHSYRHELTFMPHDQWHGRRSNERQGPPWLKYRDASPYPEVSGPVDAETLDMLKRDYAGSAGELTAITQYVFQSIAARANKPFADALLQIAIVEMTHLDMLGDAIITLGGDPQFSDGQRQWDTSGLDYSQDLEAMIRVNIDAEETAIVNYEKHAALTVNKTVSKLLRRIAEDEELHLRFLKRALGFIEARNDECGWFDQ